MASEEAYGEVIFDINNSNAGDELSHSEIWDDTLLIQRYDESMNQARQLLAKKLVNASSISDSDCSNSHRTELVNGFSHSRVHNTNLKKKKKKKNRKKNEWHIGDPCRAKYSEDDLIYEATIIGINNSDGTCTVRFVGYSNHEDVSQCSLLKSKGEAARKLQLREATGISEQLDDTETGCSVDSDASTESEKLTSMPPPKMSRISKSGNERRSSRSSIPIIPNLPPPPALGLVGGPDKMSSEALHTMLMSWYMTGYHTGFYQGINEGKTRSRNTAHSNLK